jgi:hypothetical protein
MTSWYLLFNQKDLKDQDYMGCEKREAIELLLLTTIYRSNGCTNSSLDIYKLYDSTSSSRSKHSEEVLVAGGHQVDKPSMLLILGQLPYPNVPTISGVSTPPQYPYFRSSLALLVGVSISRKTSIKLSRLARVSAKHPTAEPSRCGSVMLLLP